MKVYETFPDIEEEINALISSGRCAMLERPDMKKQVLYAPPPGDQASEAMRTMWHAVDVPKADELQQLLLKRKVRSADDLAERKKRKAAEQKARNEAAARPKKRAATYRVVTNHHLLDEDPALFGDALRGAAAAQAAQAAKARNDAAASTK